MLGSRRTVIVPNLEAGSMTDSPAAGRTDSATKVIPAPPQKLYAAFADGETLMEWLPPPKMTGRALEYQFREGGSYRIELRYRDGAHGAGKTTGDSDISTGRFVDLIPNRRIRETVRAGTPGEGLGDGAHATRLSATWIAACSAAETSAQVSRYSSEVR